jgi:hypothetical protein
MVEPGQANGVQPGAVHADAQYRPGDRGGRQRQLGDRLHHSGDHHLITFDSAKRDTGQVVANGTNPAIVALVPNPTGAAAPGQAPLTLTQNPMVNGFIPFSGQYLPAGVTQPGHLVSFT